MKVEYDLTIDDLVAFNLYSLRRSPNVRLRRWVWNYLLFAAAALTLLSGVSRASFDASLLGVWLFIFWFCFHDAEGRMEKGVRRLYNKSKNKKIFSKYTVTLAPDAIMESTEFSESKRHWSAIEKIVVEDEHVMVYTNPTTAYIIPRRAFPDEAKFREFIETARRYHASAAS